MQELVILIQQIIILILLLCLPWDQYERRFKGWWKKYWQKPKQAQARHLRPRDPSSCAACCSEQHLPNQERGQASPWEQVKSRRGRPREQSGFAPRKAGIIREGRNGCKIRSFQSKIALLEADDKRKFAIYPHRDEPIMVATVSPFLV
jgi:hypothetical protein